MATCVSALQETIDHAEEDIYGRELRSRSSYSSRSRSYSSNYGDCGDCTDGLAEILLIILGLSFCIIGGIMLCVWLLLGGPRKCKERSEIKKAEEVY